MCSRKKVLSAHNGNLNSKVLFIAEAPGRLGAECTGIPLCGDKTGNNFELLLHNIGWKREDVFITNAILCNPQDAEGNNSTPTKEEILNCSYYLEMIIELINPEIIVTLGAKALEALRCIKDHKYILNKNVAQTLSWNGRNLFPLYHMGPRAIIHRSMIKQRADFIKLSHEITPLEGKKTKRKKASEQKESYKNSILLDMVMAILTEINTLSFFKLTKLLYLVDYKYLSDRGNSMSGGIYLRMQEGPWIPYLRDISATYNGDLFTTTYTNKKPILHFIKNYSSGILTPEQHIFIKEIIKKYKAYDDSKIKTAVYMTKPMKYILKEEKTGRNMTKTPVLYRDSTIVEMDEKNDNQQ
jgi:uracil-DNA glycosylase family 4